MPNSSVYLSQDLIERLDRVAARRGISRNRLIRNACTFYLEQNADGEWPEDFFVDDDLSPTELRQLRSSGEELMRHVEADRRSKRDAPL